MFLRQSTAVTVTVGPILDSAGVAKTDEVVGSIRLAKAGGTPAAANGSATLTHRHTGVYSLALTVADTGTIGTLEVSLNSGTNTMSIVRHQIVEELIYDASYASGATGPTAAKITLVEDTVAERRIIDINSVNETFVFPVYEADGETAKDVSGYNTFNLIVAHTSDNVKKTLAAAAAGSAVHEVDHTLLIGDFDRNGTWRVKARCQKTAGSLDYHSPWELIEVQDITL